MRAGWRTEKLGEVCSFLNRGISPRYLDQGGICVLNQKCIRDHRVSYEQSRRHDVEAKAVTSDRVIRVGDVLVNSTGTGTLGRVAQVRDAPEELTTVDSHVTIVRPKPGKFHPEFFGYMLVVIEEAIKEAGEGCGGQTELARSVLAERFSVSYPASLAEQQRIVGILDEAFERIATAKANCEKNLQNARALFDSDLDAILSRRGEDWIDRTLDQVCIVERGSSPRPIKNYFTTKPDGVNWIKIGDTEEGGKYVYSTAQKITPEGAKQSRFVKVGDFILTNSMSFGRPYIMKTTGCIHDGWFVLRLNASIDTDYFYYLLSSGFVQSQFARLASGAVVKNISGDLVKQAVLPIPPLAQQHQIVEKVIRLSEETQRLESLYQRKLAALDELKKSLLHQAFSGQLTAAVSSSAVVPFPVKLPNINTTDLHAGILAMAYQHHEQKGNPKHFGHVKAEKIAHMVEAYVGVDLGRQPIKDAAGPNDYPHLKNKVEPRAKKAGYFDFQRTTEAGGYRVTKLRQFDALIEKTRAALGDHVQAVDRLLDLLLPMNTQQAEVMCTVYAGWNNLLLEGRQPSDEEIVYESRENWHTAKMTIPREKFFAAIGWLKEKDIVPRGKGRKVLAKGNKK